MRKYDILIKGGTVVDGRGTPRRAADIGIKDGLIADIGAGLDGEAGRVINAAGKIVAPGIIDPHTHYDAQINWDPYCTNSGWHANTTVVVGNCGFGFMPCRAADRDRYMMMMENTEQVPLGAMRTALPWTWETFPEWMEHMKQLPKGVNVASFLPLNSLMIYVMGYEAAKTRGANDVERAEMRRLLNEAMDHGAIGFGFSYLNEFNSHKDCDGTPMPTDAMQIEDAYFLAEVLRERGEGVIQCLAELPVVVSNREACENLARISGRPVIHSVISAFDKLPSYHTGILEWLDTLPAKGIDNIYTQALAFRASTEITIAEYNGWQQVDPFFEFSNAGDRAAKVALASDPDYRARANAQYDPARMEGASGAIETLRVVLAPDAPDWQGYVGMLLGDIAVERGTSAIDALLDLVIATGANGELRVTESTTKNAEWIRDILAHPHILAGTSDGGAHVKNYSGGHFATDNIMQMVRETGLMTLEQLHHKFSSLPARVLGFDRRGEIAEGYWADLFVYDFDKLDYDSDAYEVLHDLPDGDCRRVVRAKGIEYIVVNGQVTLEDSEPTGNLSGRMIGGSGPAMDEELAASAPLLSAAE